MDGLRRAWIAGLLLASGLLVGSARVAQSAPEAPRGFGLIPASKEDLLRIEIASAPFSGAELPRSVDLSASMPPPRNQGGQSSCVAWAIAYALKSYQEKIEEKLPFLTPDGRVDERRVFSPGFIYSQVNQGRDGGCKFEDALNVVKDYGAAPWSEMPYEEAGWDVQPSSAARAAARRYRIDKWDQVQVVDERGIKAQLNAGYPVVFGARVDEGFRGMRNGVWNAPYGKDLGNHAMVLVGYDDAERAFKLINSWGQQWGQGGYGWVSYGHFRRVTNEAYVAKDARNGPAPEVAPPPPDGVEPPPPVPPDGVEPVPKPPPLIEILPPPPLPTSFALTRVDYNARLPMDPTNALYLVFHGTLGIPAGAGYQDQVVVGFYFADERGGKLGPVPAKLAQFSTVSGQAACGTAPYAIPPEGFPLAEWHVWIPNDALDVVPGVWEVTPNGPVYVPHAVRLVAEPVLFLDGFGVAKGNLVPFLVSR